MVARVSDLRRHGRPGTTLRFVSVASLFLSQVAVRLTSTKSARQTLVASARLTNRGCRATIARVSGTQHVPTALRRQPKVSIFKYVVEAYREHKNKRRDRLMP
jgi:hypothetical protein